MQILKRVYYNDIEKLKKYGLDTCSKCGKKFENNDLIKGDQNRYKKMTYFHQKCYEARFI